MRIWLDGELRSELGSAGLRALQEECEKITASGCYIKTIRINGEEKSLGEILNGSIGELIDNAEIQIETCTLDELVENTMYSVVEYAPKLYSSWMKAIDAWHVGLWTEGTEHFLAGLDGLKWNVTVLTDLSALGPQDSELAGIAKQGQELLTPLLEAWEGEDFVQLADILEFKAIPWLTRWQSLAVLFQEQMRLENLKRKIH